MGSSQLQLTSVHPSEQNSDENMALSSLVLASENSQHQSILVPQLFSVPQGIELKQMVQRICAEISTAKAASPEAQALKGLSLDFQHTQFMDSSGIGSLIACRRLLEEQNVELILRNLSPQVYLVLQLTELDQVFKIESETAPPPEQVATIQSGDIVTHPSVHSRAKRLLDIIGSLVGLAITAVAAIPIIVAIKREDGGPIFFAQRRCSWLGKPFTIWKFRSMVTNAEARKAEVRNEVDGALFKSTKDHRITRIGKFLRRTSLDELPQFWNVLRGEMSLVGTRPPTLEETEQYEIPQWRRLDIKPGMTGEWQVNGRSTVKTFEDVVQLDLKYQRNWTLWYDIKLIVKTIGVVFTKDSGAM